jgi:hypothetical protein
MNSRRRIAFPKLGPRRFDFQLRPSKQEFATSDMGRKWSICAAEILNRACRRWVKTGKAQTEQMFSAFASTADIDGCGL